MTSKSKAAHPDPRPMVEFKNMAPASRMYSATSADGPFALPVPDRCGHDSDAVDPAQVPHSGHGFDLSIRLQPGTRGKRR